jgi:hypothetical protein
MAGAISDSAITSLKLTDDTCAAGDRHESTDLTGVQRSKNCPDGLRNKTAETCCAACNADSACTAWILAEPSSPDPTGMDCWLVSSFSGTGNRPGRMSGFGKLPPPPPPPPSPQGRDGWWIVGRAADWCVRMGEGYANSRSVLESVKVSRCHVI